MIPHLPGIYNLTNPDYIGANRRGVITPEQAFLLGPSGSKFVKRFQPNSRLNGIAVILLLVFFLILQVAGIELSIPIALGAFGVLLVVVAVQIGNRWIKVNQQASLAAEDLDRGLIQGGVGSLQFGEEEYYVLIGNRELKLPLGSIDGLSPGISYYFYYLPESGIVISAEPLEEG
jgi:hypothetical protein